MKSARELFEELGYECDESCNGILYAKPTIKRKYKGDDE